MKKLFCAAALGVALAASAGAQAADKIAVVNLSQVFQQSPQRAAVAKQLEGEFSSRASDLQAQQQKIQGEIQDLQRNASTMKASDRTKKEKQIASERAAFEQKAQAFDKDNQTRQMQERNKLLAKIQTAVQSVAKSDGYDLVLDSQAVLYSSADAKDITADVVKQVK
ncbi:OmpH family outer membrane protein [Erwinia sp. S63]|uniref:Chaperone protein Skp n=1 Tax=Candidatus Pantoea communis TaxID=2608354 RepID=A0ABX0RQW2_9GAMM|nr:MULTISPECIES: OmpH family outer membrane protein [Enterobacterales]MBK0096951.1 OmpH family outer membrane protein [Erwinia sp. S63]MBS0882320.1 OmpH family outer membrane protein [Pantoea sp. JGM49]MDF7630976.1 OmpH family outer membrane protein [Erwiniaceae bacterium L1_55_4]MXP53632.1 molecular chaperone [Pantoea sp. Seng]MXP60074.1 molecular chaperone [Pantoea sp. Taur]NIG20000.1 molecular chaperone [Pantoea communis]HAU5566229.1 molecular chaperone [Serratia fonticola]